jgi:hypothetical protein
MTQEQKRLYMQSWRKRNKERIKAYNQQWRAENTDYFRKYYAGEIEVKPKPTANYEDRVRQYDKTSYLRIIADPVKRKIRFDRIAKAHAKYPERMKARQLLNTAVDSGKLYRPDICSSCGNTCVPHGHHSDYTKPLEVTWLCYHCHRQLHSSS